MKYYKCGHIMTTHGLKGDLKVNPLTDFNRFYPNSKLYILHNEKYVEVIVNKSVPFGKYLLVSFKDYDNINLVVKFHSDDIYICEEDRKDDLSDDEFYYSDLIGKKVVNQNNEDRGVVVEIQQLPQSQYLVVKYNDKRVLIPFIKEFIKEVNDNIVVNEIEGLFWK